MNHGSMCHQCILPISSPAGKKIWPANNANAEACLASKTSHLVLTTTFIKLNEKKKNLSTDTVGLFHKLGPQTHLKDLLTNGLSRFPSLYARVHLRAASQLTY